MILFDTHNAITYACYFASHIFRPCPCYSNRRKITPMAKTKEAKPKRPRGRPRLPESEKKQKPARKARVWKTGQEEDDFGDFMAKIGKKGGKNTLKNNGADYYAKIAILSHQRRRENAAEARRQLLEAQQRAKLGIR